MLRSIRALLARPAFALVLLALAMAPPRLGAAEAAAPLTVFAAASLKESMDDAAAAYQQATGIPVRVSYAASSTLARQVEAGAPADVFFSADLDWMDELAKQDLLRAQTRRNLLGNDLVLVAPADSTAKVDMHAPQGIAAALGSDGRLAVGKTDSVPAGKYARASLESLGIWTTLQPRLAESDSVRSALLLVSRGQAPLGIVYGSDAKADPGVRVVAVFPASSHDPIIYPVAALKNGDPRAAALVAWLAGPQARAIFERRGFLVLK